MSHLLKTGSGKIIFGYIIIALLLLGSVACSFGQTDSIDYHFLNQAVSQLPIIGNCDFILIDKAGWTWLDDKQTGRSVSARLKELNYVIDSNTLKEIIQNSHKKKSDLTFILSKTQINKVKGLHLMTAEQADTTFRMGIIKPYCTKFRYYCSLPVFSNNNEYAVMGWGSTQRWRVEFGAAYLFKKVNEKWHLLGRFDSWEY